MTMPRLLLEHVQEHAHVLGCVVHVGLKHVRWIAFFREKKRKQRACAICDHA